MIGNVNLVTTIIGFGMSSTFILFVCTRLICGRTRVADPRRTTFDPEPEIDIEQPGHRTDALEPIVVAAIPTMKFHRDAFGSDDDAQCSICLGDYEEKEILRLMPKCGHSFHLSCIDLWLMKQSTCPVCRLSVHESLDLNHTRSVSISDPLSNIPHAHIPTTHSTGNRNAGNQPDDHSTSQNPGFS
ncbi:RING-H2 finger protein ATL64-like [Silene latifolia]|uniref:RING-H2 finger protein ATL64-like n=1 Tax=Silene latifolia TaxID=37657 RepID=UPI003D783CA4